MRTVLAFLVNSFLIAGAATPLLGKAKTVKIAIEGTNFKTPIEISDPTVLAKFQVWTGPGTSSNEKQGFIIDWSQGPVKEMPKVHGVMFHGYQVSFHIAPNDRIAYVAYYAFSPGEEQGYVYLPGESDKWYGLNVRTVFRRVEGKSFRAWDAWERVARPLIEKAEHLEADPLTRERIVAALMHGRRAPECCAQEAFIGSKNTNLLPVDDGSTQILPPCARIRRLAIPSPTSRDS